MGSREKEGEHEVAYDQKDSAAHQHCRTLTLLIKEISKERSDSGSSDREPSEDIRCRGGGDTLKVTLEHVRAISLEWEDSRRIKDAKKSDDTETL